MMIRSPSGKNLSGQRQLVQQLIDRQQYLAAEKKLRALLMLQPYDSALLASAARVARRQGKPEEAKRYYLRVLKVSPQSVIALNGLGLIYFDAGDFDSAEKYYIEALKNIQGYAAAHNNYAVLLRKQGRYKESVQQYQLALAANPDYEEATFGLACLNIILQQFDEAEGILCELLKKNPNNTRYQNTYSMLLLKKGSFVEGWALYRARYSPTNDDRFFTRPNYSFTYWNGEDLTGKTILIHREQGLGDEIQFCRYITRLKREKNAAKIIYVCSEALIPLFSSLPEIDLLITSWNDNPQHADYWSMLLDLPLQFVSSSNPYGGNPPYLQADPLSLPAWASPEVSSLPLKVGVVWRGSPAHANDRSRSLPSLSSLKSLWKVPYIQWISLQKGAGEEDALTPDEDQPIVALGHRFANYADTAATIEHLDLVITVDTSVAHLAGAMGKHCWVILPATGVDWRWTHGRSDSLWYPNMRVFARLPSETLDSVIDRIGVQLNEWMRRRIAKE